MIDLSYNSNPKLFEKWTIATSSGDDACKLFVLVVSSLTGVTQWHNANDDIISLNIVEGVLFPAAFSNVLLDLGESILFLLLLFS